jgi:hypothetical protein
MRPMLTHTASRKLVAWSLPIAAVLWIAGGVIDPAVDETTSTTYFAGLAEGGAGDRYQVSALVLHFAFLAFVPAIIGLVALLPRTKVRIAAAALALMGAATLPGLVVTDYYDIALAQTLEPAQAAEVYDTAISLAGGRLLSMPAVLGITLGLIGLFVAAWRERLVPGWTSLALVVALVTPSLAGGMWLFVAAGAVMLVAFAVTSARILRPAPAAA